MTIVRKYSFQVQDGSIIGAARDTPSQKQIRNLDEVCHWFDVEHDAKVCGFCEGQGPEIVYRFASGVEASAQALRKKSAGDALHQFAIDHQRRRGGSYAAALAIAWRLNPEWTRQYLGLEE